MTTAAPTQREPTTRVIWTDPVTTRKGYVVLDRLVDGLAAGGTRVRSGVTLEEIERLAMTMTYKCGAMNLRVGGGKGGIDCDPYDPEMPAMLRRFIEAMKPLLTDTWATAEDLGITQEELDKIFADVGLGMSVNAGLRHAGDPAAARQRVLAGLAVRVEGIGLADVIGGYGVAEAALVAMTHMGTSPNDCRAVVQGFGSMGGASARYLARNGIRIVGIVDANGCIVNERGLDVELLLRARNQRGEVDRSALGAGDQELARDAWISVDAEVFVPAAIPDTLRGDNCDALQAKLVVEAANICTTPDAQQRLHERGVVVVPDFVANAGANSWWWWTINGDVLADAEAAFNAVSAAMRDTVTRMLDLSRDTEVPPREAAATIAEANIVALAGR